MTTLPAQLEMTSEGKTQARLPGLLPFALVIVAMTLWGLLALRLTVFSGNYALKALALMAIFVLALQRANHMAMLMFLPFLWMPIKTAKYATSETHIILPIGIVFVVAAWFVSVINVPRIEGRASAGRALLVRMLYWGLLLLAVLGIANADGMGRYWAFLVTFVMLGLAFVIALRVPFREEVLRRMFVAFLVAVLAFFLGWAIMRILSGGPGTFYRYVELRTGIPGFLNRYTRLALVVYGFGLGIATSRLSRRTRYLALFCGVFPSAAALLLTLSKVGLLLAPMVTIVALLFTKRRRAALAVAVLLAVAVGLFVAMEPGYAASVAARFAGLSGVMGMRSVIRQEAWKILLQHPVLGIGPGQYPYYSNLKVMTPHNGPLNFAVILGFPGLLLYTGLVVAVAYRLFVVGRKVEDPLRRAVILGARLAFLAMLAAVQAAGILDTKEAVAFMGIMGLAYVATTPSRQRQTANTASRDGAFLSSGVIANGEAAGYRGGA